MSDPRDGLVITASGVVLYGTGVSILSAYPNATGQYWLYPASAPARISEAVENAVARAGMSWLPIDAAAPPAPAPYHSNSSIARLGNNATVDAANRIIAQFGSRVSDHLEFNGVAGLDDIGDLTITSNGANAELFFGAQKLFVVSGAAGLIGSGDLVFT